MSGHEPIAASFFNHSDVFLFAHEEFLLNISSSGSLIVYYHAVLLKNTLSGEWNYLC